jgi:hypothetical protein
MLLMLTEFTMEQGNDHSEGDNRQRRCDLGTCECVFNVDISRRHSPPLKDRKYISIIYITARWLSMTKDLVRYTRQRGSRWKHSGKKLRLCGLFYEIVAACPYTLEYITSSVSCIGMAWQSYLIMVFSVSLKVPVFRPSPEALATGERSEGKKVRRSRRNGATRNPDILSG